MASKGFQVKTKVLKQIITTVPKDIESLLKIDSGAEVIKIERLRSIKEEKLLLVVNYIPYDICPGLAEEDLNDASLYGVFMEKYKLKVEEGTRTIEIVLASDSDAQLLEIPKGSPLFLVRAVSYTSNGRPIEYFETKHRGDRFKFEVKVVNFLL